MHGVQVNAQSLRAIVGMVLILIFAEVLSHYGLIVGLNAHRSAMQERMGYMAVIINGSITGGNYSTLLGYAHLAADINVGTSSLAGGMSIGSVGYAGVCATPSIFWPSG